jgi:hypothetical protein
VRIAAGLITWQDGAALTNAVASVRPYVDEIVIADGLIDGVDEMRLPWFSPLKGLLALSSHVETRLWRSQAQMRTWVLEKARAVGCDWLLVIDADEELHRGDQLRSTFDPGGVFGLLPTDDGTVLSVRMLRLDYWKRYVTGAHILEAMNGRVVQLPRQLRLPPPDSELVWVEHRPELRPAGVRRSIRLGALADRLESVGAGTVPTLA